MSHDSFKFVMRRCAKCGSEMYVTKSERQNIGGIYPIGSWIYFSCLNCGNEIKLRSRWCLILELIVLAPIALLSSLSLLALLLFFVVTNFHHFNEAMGLGFILLAILFLLIPIFISTTYEYEFSVRKQNPEIPHREAVVEFKREKGWLSVILTVILKVILFPLVLLLLLLSGSYHTTYDIYEFSVRKQNPEIPHQEAIVQFKGEKTEEEEKNQDGWQRLFLLVPFISLLSMVALFDIDKKVDETSTIQVELVGNHEATVEGRYFRSLDGVQLYKNNAYKFLLSDWEVRVPETLRVLKRNAVIQLIEHETGGQIKFTSQVYEIKTTFTIVAVPTVAVSDTTYNMVARFPAAAFATRQALKASTLSSVPEIHFNIKYYARNSDFGLAHIGKNLGFTILFALASMFIVGIGVWLGHRKLTIGILSAIYIVGTLYSLFLTLKDLWWIIGRLWGG